MGPRCQEGYTISRSGHAVRLTPTPWRSVASRANGSWSYRCRTLLELAAELGPWGGPVYNYRGAEIRCNKGGLVCTLFLEDHPPNGNTFGVVGTITPLIDIWLDHRRLADHIRALSKPAE